MTGLPTAAVTQTLEAVAPLAWGRFGTGSTEDGPAVPLLVWRYDDEPDGVGELLQRAVSTFTGRCDWTLEKPGRNWVLWPERAKREFEAGSWSSDAEYLVDLADRDPEFCDRATSDLRGLLDHLERVLEKRAPGEEVHPSDE